MDPPPSLPPFPFPPQNPAPPAPPPPPLAAAVSSLDRLIAASARALGSLSALLPPNPPVGSDLAACPSNPHHRMPPESLFRHYLTCPAPLDLGSSVQSLGYPRTSESSDDNPRFAGAVGGPGSELCLALDGYGDFRSNFFYVDCPGAVAFPIEDSDSRSTFTLPGVLSIECGNFGTDGDVGVEEVENLRVSVLPSELWSGQREIEAWSDYPNGYSYNVLRVISGVGLVKESALRRWVIVNSLRCGVVIDVAMGDHIFVLFALCLKAIVREGVSLLKTRDLKGNKGSSIEFKCPNLIQVMMWLASRLSVLYGKVNAKFFAIDMLKKCLVDAASHLLLDYLEQEDASTDKNESTHERDAGGIKKQLDIEVDGVDGMVVGNINKKVIFVSQVAAAVAALHERFLLEVKITALRHSQQPSRYQRMIKHGEITKKADDEREKRPDYKPIIDHDGLPRQWSSNQETGKAKTREELLAEERDYKRRRMSYRGKKSKRNISEVMRDIIEEYMEEIKQAGGIGCFEKGAPAGVQSNEVPSSDAIPANGTFELCYEPEGYPVYSQRGLWTNHEVTSTSNVIGDTYSEHGKSRGRYSHEDQRKSTGVYKRERHYYSRSPERSAQSLSHKHTSRRIEREDAELTIEKHQEIKRSYSGRSYRGEDNSSSRSDVGGMTGVETPEIEGARDSWKT
ncbi:LOW QUALITY PROTEIN: U11/U12 small nuclear ribonucleoprotein 48 kDa protein [Syzygium oleosum]|uniref:LOW QUALITY PROTEIN: U11/U12 small nuclear ribonucleoprotein 48 kDa protein n=1 Tax=Syzygium oleosum TaxID=219896 RepID=UPI0024BBB55B|nr:LOW QUALITY PROTEIN: U11/U12 small nuclear ribonucleoprotein 48 kDa protein [Syzygium oleosum]